MLASAPELDPPSNGGFADLELFSQLLVAHAIGMQLAGQLDLGIGVRGMLMVLANAKSSIIHLDYADRAHGRLVVLADRLLQRPVLAALGVGSDHLLPAA